MNVVIFEDDVGFVQLLEIMVRNINFNNENFNITVITSDFDKLCRYIELLEKPTVFLLDIMLGNIENGFKIADAISKQELNAIIVFITNYPNKILANSFYKIKAFNVILKSSHRLEEELTLTLQEASKFIKDSHIVVYSDKFTSVLVEVSEIYYIETINNKNKIRVCSQNGVYELRTSLSKFIKQLPDYFLRCHNSYVVNTRKITTIDYTKRSVTLSNGNICYYSPQNKKSLLDRVGFIK